MKYLTEYRDGAAAEKVAAVIARTVTRPWTIMEVCGGQTHTIVKYGHRRDPAPRGRAGARARLPGLRDTARNDRQGARDRRPGPTSSFARSATCCACPARAATCSSKSRAAATCGSSTRRSMPSISRRPILDRRVVFFAIGFETTAPPNAMAVGLARKRRLTNFSMLVSHVLVPPMMKALLSRAG